MRLLLVEFQKLHPPPALTQDIGGTVRHAQDSPHDHFHAHGVQILQLWFLHLRVALRNDNKKVVATRGCLERIEGAIAPHGEGRHHVGKHDGIPQRQKRKVLGNLLIAFVQESVHIKETKVKIVTQRVVILHKT